MITNIKNPRFSSISTIDVDITLNGEVMPFTASPNDVEEYGRTIYASALNGDYGVIADYVPIVITPRGKTQQEKLQDLLVNRGLLRQADIDGIK